MTDFEAQVLSELGALKSQMNSLLGVGQPGRLHLLEERVERHEHTVQRLKGVGGGLSVLLTLFHVALDFVRR
ncbi:hypothetical protein [Terriglobus roseus]|uniref:Uncharacterized protein n=1 Tax=Terriglobus roseus TaxID=392734 RepID=A0A1H4MW95_9BACT|nr:hypothetical protein [Terriglobus roseus]SEB87233.1 hypothetical protein SAMN05443244_2059 [Terriglobus roseus]